MNRREHLDALVAGQQGLPDGDFLKADEGRRLGWNPAEVRPDDIVEDMSLKRLDGTWQGVDLQWMVPTRTHSIHHQRKSRDMVQVGVGQEDTFNPAHLFQ